MEQEKTAVEKLPEDKKETVEISENAAIYCRLSREDEQKPGEQSESIQNQRQMLTAYANEHGWPVWQIYIDEDYSGVDRTRPAFCRMLADAKAGHFSILLVKTQSRFTRDMELVEKYIHGLLPQWGVRFIAVVDHADTAERGNKKARQISGLINEWYLEDLSENVRAVLDEKRRNGQYIGGCPLYGYLRDPANKNHLIVDREAATVIRRIFALYLEDVGTQCIAEMLNREKAANPTARKRQLGYPYHNGRAGAAELQWNRTAVRRILENQMYTGDLVQGKTHKLSYKSKKLVAMPPEKWFVVPGRHEGIISHDAFSAVQEKIKRHGR